MPFAGYDSFSDCVRANSSKEDPEAYCATIQRQVEGKSDEYDDIDGERLLTMLSEDGGQLFAELFKDS